MSGVPMKNVAEMKRLSSLLEQLRSNSLVNRLVTNLKETLLNNEI